MCGIVGALFKNHNLKNINFSEVKESISHRGPDNAGEWWSNDGRVGLAHRRLSILDLTSDGHQPMHLQERGLTIVFNGEIYNFNDLRNELKNLGYSFKSHSDTEVLLVSYAVWGIDCLSRLNGMFAFALYDDLNKEFILARDRAGEKPLFYKLEKDYLYFGSELKSLLAIPELSRNIDLEALDCFLAIGFVPGDRCILSGYNKLPPAHFLRYNLQNGDIDISRYWQLPELDIDAKISNESYLLTELERLLEDSVGRQLVADVPVGILLSGGVDSSLITAMATRRSSQVHTFSIGFPGHGKLDETQYARQIARHFGTQHTELMAESASADLLPTLSRQFDEPLIDSSMIPTYLVSHLVRQHCTVALGGDGGDELFGGYNHYSRLLWMQHNVGYLPKWIRHSLSWTAEHCMPVGFKGRNYLQGLDVDLKNGLPLLANYFDANLRRRLLHNYPGHPIVAESIRAARVPKQDDLLQRATRADFEGYMVDDILVKVDRASMLHSLEVRSPFLDYRIIEFAFSKVPSHLKATPTAKKILLKRLARKLLPHNFDTERKQGFSIPLTEWLKSGPFRDLFWDTLNSRDCLFDAKTVRNLLKGQDMGFSNGERLFALVQFELWRKTYQATL